MPLGLVPISVLPISDILRTIDDDGQVVQILMAAPAAPPVSTLLIYAVDEIVTPAPPLHVDEETWRAEAGSLPVAPPWVALDTDDLPATVSTLDSDQQWYRTDYATTPTVVLPFSLDPVDYVSTLDNEQFWYRTDYASSTTIAIPWNFDNQEIERSDLDDDQQWYRTEYTPPSTFSIDYWRLEQHEYVSTLDEDQFWYRTDYAQSPTAVIPWNFDNQEVERSDLDDDQVWYRTDYAPSPTITIPWNFDPLDFVSTLDSDQEWYRTEYAATPTVTIPWNFDNQEIERINVDDDPWQPLGPRAPAPTSVLPVFDPGEVTVVAHDEEVRLDLGAAQQPQTAVVSYDTDDTVTTARTLDDDQLWRPLGPWAQPQPPTTAVAFLESDEIVVIAHDDDATTVLSIQQVAPISTVTYVQDAAPEEEYIADPEDPWVRADFSYSTQASAHQIVDDGNFVRPEPPPPPPTPPRPAPSSGGGGGGGGGYYWQEQEDRVLEAEYVVKKRLRDLEYEVIEPTGDVVSDLPISTPEFVAVVERLRRLVALSASANEHEARTAADQVARLLRERPIIERLATFLKSSTATDAKDEAVRTVLVPLLGTGKSPDEKTITPQAVLDSVAAASPETKTELAAIRSLMRWETVRKYAFGTAAALYVLGAPRIVVAIPIAIALAKPGKDRKLPLWVQRSVRRR